MVARATTSPLLTASGHEVTVEEFLRHPRPTRAERRLEGRQARADVPLEAHAQAPDASRRDATAILRSQDADREPSLLPIRYGRTAADPTSYLRGAAAVMAADLATLPRSSVEAQLCGDAHLSNFGLFAAPDRSVVFDLNDFDETLRGPFEWDVKRLAAAVAVVGQYRGMSVKGSRRAARTAVSTYRTTIASLAERPTLDVFYARLDLDTLLSSLQKTALMGAAKKARRSAWKHTGDAATEKITEIVDGRRRFREDPPLLVPVDSAEVGALVGVMYRQYLDTLPTDRALLLTRFSFRGLAHRVGGVGSVGTRTLVMLLESGDGEPILLQLKQAGRSVLEEHLGASWFGSAHGRRVVTGQRLMQAAGDPFLGWAPATGGRPHDYYVRQLKDMKGSIDTSLLTPDALVIYGRLCAAVLARAHARAGDASVISGYLGHKDTFDEAVADFAVAYAAINSADHEALAQAIERGEVPALSGV